MKYNGVVIRLDRLFLFILNPDTYKIMDGINISEHKCYKDLKENQLMVVEVIFNDGTLMLENIDLDEFIHGNSYGQNNIFIKIKDLALFTIDGNTILEEEIRKGNLDKIANECIYKAKSQLSTNEIIGDFEIDVN